ncbi:MAG: cupin domain-containing protein [Clostridia bacterium]|nr:cupin domain-containing protein [Clostridia bacterium]
MNDYIKQISDRIRELRDILDLTAEDVALKLRIDTNEYLAYENGEKDIPISMLYEVAAYFKVDPTVLMTGDVPRMDDYTVVRGGNGIKVERYPGYSFSALAFNYKHRIMDPMIVTLSQSETAELVKHSGQEFNYVIEGSIVVTVGSREFRLDAGDSIYFCPEKPHGQRAVTETAKFLTVIAE